MSYHNQWGNWSMGGLWPASVTNVRILPSWTYQGILSIKNTVHGPEQKSILYSKFMNSDLNITMNDKVYLCYTCDIEDTIKNHDTCTLFISPVPLLNLIRFLTASEVCENIFKNLLTVLQPFAISCSKHFTFTVQNPSALLCKFAYKLIHVCNLFVQIGRRKLEAIWFLLSFKVVVLRRDRFVVCRWVQTISWWRSQRDPI